MVLSNINFAEYDNSHTVILNLKFPSVRAVVPQPFWHLGTISWKTIFPRTRIGGWFWFHPLLISCCAVWFLAGHGPILVHGLLLSRPHSRRWASGEWAKLHLCLQLLPIAHITAWAPPLCQISCSIRVSWEHQPSCELCSWGTELYAPYEKHS